MIASRVSGWNIERGEGGKGLLQRDSAFILTPKDTCRVENIRPNSDIRPQFPWLPIPHTPSGDILAIPDIPAEDSERIPAILQPFTAGVGALLPSQSSHSDCSSGPVAAEDMWETGSAALLLETPSFVRLQVKRCGKARASSSKQHFMNHLIYAAVSTTSRII